MVLLNTHVYPIFIFYVHTLKYHSYQIIIFFAINMFFLTLIFANLGLYVFVSVYVVYVFWGVGGGCLLGVGFLFLFLEVFFLSFHLSRVRYVFVCE